MEMEKPDNRSTTTLPLDETDYQNEPPEQLEPLMPKEKYLCGTKLKLVKLWEVKPDPNDEGEKLIEMNLTVESLRLATNAALFTIIFLGIVATRIFNKPETLKDTEIEKTFGNQNICLYLDFYPVPYFSPVLYNIAVFLVTSYCIASIIRVWIAYGEKKISFGERKFYNFCFGCFIFSAMIFSLCFAVQPDGKSDEAGNKEKMLVHAIPFMILETGLLLAQVAVVSFGKRVAWKKTRTEGQTIPTWFINASIIHVILMGIVTAIKLVFQTNALGNIYVGLWWSVKTDLNFMLSTLLDWSWFSISFVCPMVQSFYLNWKDRKKYNTQILNITIRDNKKAI